MKGGEGDGKGMHAGGRRLAGKGESSEWRREEEGKQKIAKGRKQLRERKVNGDWWRGR